MTGLTRQENQRMALTRRLTSEYTTQGWSDRSRGAPGVALNRRFKQESRKHDRTDTWTGPKSRKHSRADSFKSPELTAPKIPAEVRTMYIKSQEYD